MSTLTATLIEKTDPVKVLFLDICPKSPIEAEQLFRFGELSEKYGGLFVDFDKEYCTAKLRIAGKPVLKALMHKSNEIANLAGVKTTKFCDSCNYYTQD